MADLRTSILASVARAQSTFAPEVGDALLVGTRQAFVTVQTPDGVTLHYEDGLTETQPVEALRGRAISILRLRAPGDPSPSLVAVAWALAKSTVIPADVKASQLVKMAARAETPEDGATIKAWAVAVVTGRPVVGPA